MDYADKGTPFHLAAVNCLYLSASHILFIPAIRFVFMAIHSQVHLVVFYHMDFYLFFVMLHFPLTDCPDFFFFMIH